VDRLAFCKQAHHYEEAAQVQSHAQHGDLGDGMMISKDLLN